MEKHLKTTVSFNLHPHGLQIVAYYDEVETCNPLGSSSGKYKLGCIFFTLGNIRPSFRSSLKSIFLVAVARSSTIKAHGIDVLLKPFVDDLKLLHDVGIKMGQDEVWKGALLAFLADNLAAHELGGFKQSFSFAHRFCRSCMATKDDSRTNFRECEFTLRDPVSHVQQCSLLEGHDSVKSSVEYGINRHSLLDEIPCFSVVKAMPHDIMHDLFEGVIPYELKLLIDHCSIANSYFSLATLNHRITAFDYGYSEIGDKPALIRECKLRQTASQMWLLARTFPLLVDDLVPRDFPNWLCFLKFIKICEICTSAVLTADYVAYLDILIEEHHLDFVKLYPTKSVIPKMHFMVHFPQQILNYGPLVHTWTMRHEAKLRVIKHAARVSNFKNVCKTVAKRHQHLLCFYIQSSLLIGNIVKIGVCKPFHTSSQPETLMLLLNNKFGATNIMILSFVTSSGVTYKPHAYILFKNDELSPVFCKILLILKSEHGEIFLVVNEMETLFFDSHFNCYCINTTSRNHVCEFEILPYKSVFHVRRSFAKDNRLYIVLKCKISFLCYNK